MHSDNNNRISCVNLSVEGFPDSEDAVWDRAAKATLVDVKTGIGRFCTLSSASLAVISSKNSIFAFVPKMMSGILVFACMMSPCIGRTFLKYSSVTTTI